MTSACKVRINLLNGNRWFCSVAFTEGKRKHSSTLVEMKDCAAGVGPGRGDAAYARVNVSDGREGAPLSRSNHRRLIAKVKFNIMEEILITGEFL